MTKIALGICALLLAGCGGTAPSDQSAEPEKLEKQAPKKVSEKMQGEYKIVLGPEEQEQLDVMRLALKDPAPTEEEIKAANLSEEEGMMVAMVMMAKAEDPNDPKIAEMVTMLGQMENATLMVTGDKISMAFGDQKTEASYTITSETADTVKVTTKEEDGTESPNTITLQGDKTLVIVEDATPDEKMTFVRK